MQKLKGFFIAVGILILVFIIAFFATDIIMKIIVGHRNEVIVPDLQGMNYEIACKKCKELKLYVT